MHIDPRPAVFKTALHEIVTILTIMLVQTFNQFGSGITMPMMNVLGDSFDNSTTNDKVWFMAAFPLTSGTFILISGRFGDLYGLKKVLLCGTAWAAIWTMICGLSLYTKNVIFFCVARGLQGIGLAFMLPLAIGVAGSLYPPGQRKAFVFCLVAACAPFGATFSAILGGVFAQCDIVPWAFYTNALCFLFIFISTLLFIPTVPLHVPAEGEDKPAMDWIGSALAIAGLVLFNFAWNQAPAVGWDKPYIIVLLIVGIICLGLFAYVEGKVKSPLVPREVLTVRTGMILIIMFLGWASFSIWTFYYWSFILNLRKYKPIIAGVTYLTLLTFGFVAAAVVSFFIRRVRPSYIMVGASVGFLIGIAMLSATPVHQSYWHMIFPQMIILSFGMDMSFPAASLILSDTLPKKHQGMASSLVSTITNYSMSVSLGMGTIAETKVYERTGDLLKGYRAAEYVGCGLASLGVLLALVLHVSSYRSTSDKSADDGPLTDQESSQSGTFDTVDFPTPASTKLHEN